MDIAGSPRRTDCRLSRQPRVMELALMYRALASGEVDVIAGDATSALIRRLDLVMLEDDRRYFPPYDAIPVARTASLLGYPQMRSALAGASRARCLPRTCAH